MTATEHVILVDQDDTPIGTEEKLAAHRAGLCHRAFSVFVFRQAVTPEILLQQRAFDKYHSAGLWTNTCCSHPRPGESVIEAGERRLYEEMGIKANLEWAGKFHYIAQFDNGLTENEIDHVLVGLIDSPHFEVNPKEVQSYRWIGLNKLEQEILSSPEQFTPWLKNALEIVKRKLG